MMQEGLLKRMKNTVVGQPLDGLDFTSFNRHSKSEAGKDSFAINQNSASAAITEVAADLHAGETKLLAQDFSERPLRLNGKPMLLTVDS
jgi:hypothetical protein